MRSAAPTAEPPRPAAPALAPGTPLLRALSAGERFECGLTAGAGQYLRIGVDVRGVEAEVRLVGPDGGVLATARPRGGPERRALSLVTPAGGSYRIAAVAAEVTGRGRVRLEIEKLRPALPGDPERVEVARAMAERLAAALAGPELSDEALVALAEALAAYRRTGDRNGEAAVLNALGESYLDRGKPKEAAEWFEQALLAAYAAGSGIVEADALNNLATVWSLQGHPQEGIELHRGALAVLEREEDARERGRTEYQIGYVTYYFLKDLDTAEAWFQRALDLGGATGDLVGQAQATAGFGLVAARRNELDRALASFEAALSLCRQAGDKRLAASLVRNMAIIHKNRGEPQRALDLYREALANGGEPRTEALVLHDLASLHAGLGDLEEALARYEQAVPLLAEARPDEELTARINAGVMLQLLGDLPAAVERFDNALTLARTRGSRDAEALALLNLGRARVELGSPREALDALDRALDIQREEVKNALAEAMTLLEMGSAQRALGDAVSAAVRFDEALALARRRERPGLVAACLLRRGELARDRGDLAAARADAEEALRIVESVRSRVDSGELRSSFVAAKRSSYELLVDVLVRQAEREPEAGHLEDALAASERGRARGLLDLIAEGRIDVERGVSPDLKQKETELARDLALAASRLEAARAAAAPEATIAAWSQRLTETERKQAELERELRVRNPRYAEVRYPEPLAAGQIRALLDERTALLEYWLGEEGSFLFVVTREGIEPYRLPPAAAVESKVREVRAAVAQPGRTALGRFTRAAAELYETLLAPAAAAIADKPDLVVVPDGALHLLPFEVLLTAPVRAGASWDRLPYLLRRHAVAYVPSASVLASLREARPAPPAGRQKRFLAFADPFYGEATAGRVASIGGAVPPARDVGPSLPRLPQTAHEVEGIASLYPAEDRAIYLGQDASEATLKASPYLATAERVHFATHGAVDEQRPERSWLALARPVTRNGDDGFLRVHEIFNLDLAADMVTLSACETGLGKQITGEGLVGLARAFFYAGARSLLVSLWKVSEDTTPGLMIDVYERLEHGKGKAEALRRAKLGLVEGGGTASHPFYWASFVLVGDPEAEGKL